MLVVAQRVRGPGARQTPPGSLHRADGRRGVTFEILWDHQVWFYDVWGVPRNGPNQDLALDFIRFATESLANQMRYIPYGPVRRFECWAGRPVMVPRDLPH